jgi:hypothetical protein
MDSIWRTLLSLVCCMGALGTVGCSSLGAPKSSIDIPFNELMESRTLKINRYSGMTNLYLIHAVVLAHEVTNAQTQILASDYQWPESRIRDELEKQNQIDSTQTQIFLDFYLPDSSVDDLLEKNSVWRLFLDAGGKRYEGHVEKMKRPFAETLSIFPYHNKWTTPYVVSFAVPVSTAEQGKVVFTLTGPVGSEAMTFDRCIAKENQ